MRQHVDQRHLNDAQGNPAGGTTSGVGISISWQNGPLGRGADRKLPNGAFVEGVLLAARGRLEFFQGSKFASAYNAAAIDHIEKALECLDARTSDREGREVEGTHEV